MPTPSDADEPVLNFAAISTHASAMADPHRLVLRYSDAILAYATALLGNKQDAEDLHLVIVQNMLEGKFSEAAADRHGQAGRFRFFVRKAVRNTVLNEIRRRSREAGRLRRIWRAVLPSRGRAAGGLPGPVTPGGEEALEQEEWTIWRAAVLRRAIEAALGELKAYEDEHRHGARPNAYHTLARLLGDHPGEGAEQLAERLGREVGGSFNPGQVRGLVHRMRKRLAELLVEEIVALLGDPSLEDTLDELSELGLLPYVQPYLPPAGHS